MACPEKGTLQIVEQETHFYLSLFFEYKNWDTVFNSLLEFFENEKTKLQGPHKTLQYTTWNALFTINNLTVQVDCDGQLYLYGYLNKGEHINALETCLLIDDLIKVYQKHSWSLSETVKSKIFFWLMDWRDGRQQPIPI